MPDPNRDFKELRKVVARYRITAGKGFRLKRISPGDTHGLDAEDKPRSRDLLAQGVSMLAELQDKLYAQDRKSLLLVFQAMDAAGKDGTIKHVMSGVNPAGVQVHSFKAPSPEELDHDYMWRCWRALPERGRIGIFNRSYYEEVLVVRVHREILAAQKLPPALVTKELFKDRLRDIARFEHYLARNGTQVLKFFLHVSKAEQKKRFLERIEEPVKNWKFAPGDVAERAHWDEYMAAYEDAIRATATEESPWYVVPADNKWFTRLVVVGAIVRALQGMHLAYPEIDPRKEKGLQEARIMLTRGDEAG
ncbi:MAG TPA: polyphosphate kinase 2 family protein [Burkholderiaceae bacterium]|nr:polyphosphate kinase 2 family protein [Burkholderiaceae bacterium]